MKCKNILIKYNWYVYEMLKKLSYDQKKLNDNITLPIHIKKKNKLVKTLSVWT